MPYGPETQEEVRRVCAGLSGADWTAEVHAFALSLKVHPATVYRWLGSDLLRRSRRADCGRRRVPLSERELKRLIALTVRYAMTAEDVIDHAEANGWVEPGTISVATYNRFLRARHVSLDRLTTPGRMDKRLLRTRLKTMPHRRWQAAYANDLHQIDVTELPRYFVEADGSIGYESPLTFGRNKKGNRRPRLNLFALVDDFSRASFGRLYYGKNALNWIDFCMRSWDEKEDKNTFPFCGRPLTLYSDNDSAPGGGMFDRFVKDMDVSFQSHEVGAPQAKGKVERYIRSVKEKLIAILRIHIDQGRKIALEEGNAILQDLLYKLNYRNHSETREQPMLRWSSNLNGPVRMLPSPEIRERYFYDSAECYIHGDLTIRFGGSVWQLPRKEPFIAIVGEKAQVYFHRGQKELSEVVVMVDDREHHITMRAAAPDQAGEFKSLPKGKTEQLLDEVYEEDLKDFQAGKVYKRKYAKLMFPAASEAFDETTISTAGPRKLLSKVALKLRLKDDGIQFTREEVDALYSEFGEVADADYERVVARLRKAG